MLNNLVYIIRLNNIHHSLKIKRGYILKKLLLLVLLLSILITSLMTSCKSLPEEHDKNSTAEVYVIADNIRGYSLLYYHDKVRHVGVWTHGESIFVLPDGEYLSK